MASLPRPGLKGPTIYIVTMAGSTGASSVVPEWTLAPYALRQPAVWQACHFGV